MTRTLTAAALATQRHRLHTRHAAPKGTTMTPHTIDRTRALLARLPHLTGTEAADAIANEIIETGGSMIDPEHAPDHTSHLVEICLHDITAIGSTWAEAAQNWATTARRVLEAQGLPFPMPRNHTEEIANVRHQAKAGAA